MKKIKYWFFMLFKNGKKAVYEEGGFKVTFRNYDMRIETLSRNFSVKIMAGEYPFGYLAASYAQDKRIIFTDMRCFFTWSRCSCRGMISSGGICRLL